MSDTPTAVDSKAVLRQLARLVALDFRPQPTLFYKPMGSGGVAMKVNLRLEPEFKTANEDEFVVKDKKQGFFIELAERDGQIEVGGKKYPKFAWQDPKRTIRAKLGLADISEQLAAFEAWRDRKEDLPAGLQYNGQTNVYSKFHKFGAGNSAISLTFQPEATILRVSKQYGKGEPAKAQSISLSLAEEIVYRELLRQAMRGLLKIGLR